MLRLGAVLCLLMGGCDRDNPTLDDDMGAGDGGMSDMVACPPGTLSDPQNCCGAGACGSGQLCIAGACKCPPYQSFCNGACMLTVGDPNNCGGCGVKCMGADVCSAGKCSSMCQTGFSPCGGTCIDFQTDSKHCNGCNNPCPPNQGCVKGQCKPALNVTPPGKCAGGGPPIVIPGFGAGAAQDCAGGKAQVTFTWAVCSCGDAMNQDKLIIDAFDSTQGPYTPPTMQVSQGAGLGVNGAVLNSNPMADLTTYGPVTAAWINTNKTTNPYAMTNSKANNYFDVQVGGPLHNGTQLVKGDVYSAGDVTGGALTANKLFLAPGKNSSGTVTAQVVSTPVSVAPPCACGPQDLIDVSGIVAAAMTTNDNALIGLDANLFATSPPANNIQRLDLPCGYFYLSKITTNQPVAIVAHGPTALFIGGDIANAGEVTITVDPSAQLDIFVKGTVVTNAALTIGSRNFPALTRTYVGGTADVSLSADDTINGMFYDATAKVSLTSDNNIFGALFTGSFENQSMASIHYDRAVLSQGTGCPQPPDGGVYMCNSCMDCGNQACINGKCDACTMNSQCCPPLVCQNGTCVLPVQ